MNATNYVVSCAGSAKVNGTYTEDGTGDGNTWYTAAGNFEKLVDNMAPFLDGNNILVAKGSLIEGDILGSIGACSANYTPQQYQYRTINERDWNEVMSGSEVWKRRETNSSDPWETVTATGNLPDYHAESITVPHWMGISTDVTIDQTTIVEGGGYNGRIEVFNTGMLLLTAEYLF